MIKRTYTGVSLNMHQIAEGLKTRYTAEKFDVEQIVDDKQGLVQIKKEGFLRTITGLGKALAVHMDQIEEGLHVTVGIQDKLSKLVVADLASPVTALVGAADEAHLAHKIMDEVDKLIRQQDPNVQFA
jgi:hypothetical protein